MSECVLHSFPYLEAIAFWSATKPIFTSTKRLTPSGDPGLR